MTQAQSDPSSKLQNSSLSALNLSHTGRRIDGGPQQYPSSIPNLAKPPAALRVWSSCLTCGCQLRQNCAGPAVSPWIAPVFLVPQLRPPASRGCSGVSWQAVAQARCFKLSSFSMVLMTAFPEQLLKAFLT